MPTPGNAGGAGLPRDPATRRQLYARLRALKLGATMTATLGGIACYALLLSWHVPAIWALVAGLVFAVLGRMAIIALAGEWLLSSARRLEASRSRNGGPAAGPPPQSKRGK